MAPQLNESWGGRTAWAGPIPDDARVELLNTLKLPLTTGPARFHLTEFEHDWPYQLAASDVYFGPAFDQMNIRREPVIEYVRATPPVDPAAAAVGLGVVACLALWTLRGRRS